MKRIISMLIVLLMVFSFCGCESASDKKAELTGTWEYVGYYSSDIVYQTLVALDFYEEEIAMLDTGSMAIVNRAVFNEDNGYALTVNVEESLAAVENFYRNAFATFYTNRAQLEACYGIDLVSLSEAEFYQLYADMYSVADFETLIDTLSFETTDEEHLLSGAENGTYRISGDKIYMKPMGSSEEEYVDFSIDGNKLTLEYSNASEVYTKVSD